LDGKKSYRIGDKTYILNLFFNTARSYAQLYPEYRDWQVKSYAYREVKSYAYWKD